MNYTKKVMEQNRRGGTPLQFLDFLIPPNEVTP